jgi:hypothetical protein
MSIEPTPTEKEYAGERDMDAFWAAAVPAREPINKRWYIPAALLLMLIGTPWMWPSGEEGPVFAGLPVWVWVTIGATFCLSALTAFGAIRLWGDDDEAE